MSTKIRLVILLLIASFSPLWAQLRLPPLISSGMVLQRDVELHIWGWADPGERIDVRFAGSAYQTVADQAGTWKLQLPPQKAGGPYDMIVRGNTEITVSDVMIGDVWVCSGQSNMELKMKRVRLLYEREMATADNPNIRHFEVPQEYNFSGPQTEMWGGYWKKVTPGNVPNFPAVAYFFAVDVYEKYKIPIGLINATVGGSPAEAWMSESALKNFPEHYAEAQKFKDTALIRKIETEDYQRTTDWYATLWKKDAGLAKPNQQWFDASYDFSGWKTMQIPGYWAQTEFGPLNGSVWFRKNVTIPASMAGQEAFLNLGRIVDADSVYINGILVGSTSYQYPPRWYQVPKNVLKAGKNSFVIRVINTSGKGGFVPDKPYELIAGSDTVDLKGEWHYSVGAIMEPLADRTFIRWKPAGLFNAMIHPLLPYRIKGVIWYQGEGNTRRAAEYAQLFPSMIRDWRDHWKQGDFPFLFVQLASFMEQKPDPSESEWALLRESQQRALSLPKTGMAVAIDVGEWNDIHPLNKKEVGKRLALTAQKVAYDDKNVVYSGPIFRTAKFKNGKAVISFDQLGSGLMVKGGGVLQGFAVAGADKRFVWAEARIENNEIVVQSPKVPEPVAVRYAWADNPANANLYNRDGLPAAPFRTDDWPLKPILDFEKVGLKDIYKDYFPVGVAVNPLVINGKSDDFIKRHFNNVTADNALKMNIVHPLEAQYNWYPADKIVQFATENGLRMRGSALCSHSQAPRWFFTDATGKTLEKEVLLTRLRSHILEVVGHYKGTVYAWDVVSEAVAEGGTSTYRNSGFYEIAGEEYIAKAFEYAHEADPNALLFYADYHAENPEKSERIYQMLKALLKKGVPVHGVALQGHWSVFEPKAADLEVAIERFASLGLQVQITELDVSVYPIEYERREKRDTDNLAFTSDLEERQAAQYRTLFEVFRKHRRQITGITFYTLTDKSSWLDHFPVEGRKDFPTLFNPRDQPKKAFREVTDF